MSCERVYRSVMYLLGESAQCLSYVEQVVDLLFLLQTDWNELASDYAQARELPFDNEPVCSLSDSYPLPAAFWMPTVYSVVATLCEREEPSRADLYRNMARDCLAKLRAELPAKVHAIVDCYA